MPETLTAIVVGAGQAARAQIDALRNADVEVIGVLAASNAIARRFADELQIPHSGSVLETLLADHPPQIVAIANTADARLAQIPAAISAGCHLLCERPLGINAEQARQFHDLATDRGIKTAFSSSLLFQPQAIFLRELIAQGEIGRIQEVEVVSHTQWPRLTPRSWQHQLQSGGGRLNQLFPQSLLAVKSVLQLEILAVQGHCRCDLTQAPEPNPDLPWKSFARRTPTEEELARMTWSPADADTSYTVNVLFGRRGGSAQDTVSVLFRHAAYSPAWQSDTVSFLGETGTLQLIGPQWNGDLLAHVRGKHWEERAIPFEILDQLPLEQEDSRRNLMTLVLQFVAEIRGDEEFMPYPTFRDGWICQAAIDAVRKQASWVELPSERT